MKTRGGTTSLRSHQNQIVPVVQAKLSKARDKIRDKTNNIAIAAIAPTSQSQTTTTPTVPKQQKPHKKKKKKPRRSQPTPNTTNDSISRTSSSLSYLQRWENARSEWKFEKLTQVWLLKNALRPIINDEHFEILLNYLTLLQGAAKVGMLKEMKEHMEGYEKRTTTGTGTEKTEEDEFKYERARQIVQMLAEDEEI